MKAVRVIIGLIYDDPWLVGGIILALLIIKGLTMFGQSGPMIGVGLMVLLFAAIAVSVIREAKKYRLVTRTRNG